MRHSDGSKLSTFRKSGTPPFSSGLGLYKLAAIADDLASRRKVPRFEFLYRTAIFWKKRFIYAKSFGESENLLCLVA